jgi:shikimate dehydrogenase
MLRPGTSAVRIIGSPDPGETGCSSLARLRRTPFVTSATLIEKCCLIASPVAGNPTHFMIEQAFLLAGLDWRFMSFEVDPKELGDAMRGIRALGFRGVKVAEPHQVTVLEYLDELTERARLSGSVNCVTSDGSRLMGDNTEGLALVDLVRNQMDLTGQKAMIVGSGRLARVIAVALAEAGVASLTVASRSPESGRRLVDFIASETAAAVALMEFSEREPIKIAGDVSLLVNASSLSTADPEAALPIELAGQPTGGTVVDVSYGSPSTWLTQQAAKRGCRVIDGVELFVEQTALAFSTWTGVRPDKNAMHEAAEEFLEL